MISLHNHTIYSHDGHSTVNEIIESAIEKNMKAVALTDHIDMLLFEERNIYENAKSCYADFLKAKEKYDGKIKILMGAEMGEEIFEPEKAQKIRNIGEFDVFLASCHFVKSFGYEYDVCYADVPMWSHNKINRFLNDYFDILLKTVKETDFDVLSHLDYPLRYANAIYKKDYDTTKHDSVIKEILKIVAKKGKALEVNTKNGDDMGVFLPSTYYLNMFNEVGGKYVTLGSDAHFASRLLNGIEKGKKLLKDCGFDDYYYFEKRKPYPVSKLK
ncbi:MAG: histidinol-phosphatase HisJ family protein [Clostridia bacterium]|nr:histidinol-phosphatase HisJ family protein [Clostridia bacterium]